MDFEPKRGEIVFCIFLQKEAVSGQTKCSPFSFSLGPIFVQNMSKIDFSTCAAVRSKIVERRTFKALPFNT